MIQKRFVYESHPNHIDMTIVNILKSVKRAFTSWSVKIRKQTLLDFNKFDERIEHTIFMNFLATGNISLCGRRF